MATLIVGVEGAGIVVVKEAAANSVGAAPFLHIIRSAIAIEDDSPSKVGPGRSIERGRQGEGVEGESYSPSGVVISCQISPSLEFVMGKATCQHCFSSLMINAIEILTTLILSNGLFQAFDLQLTCKDVCSSEEAGGSLFV